MHGCIVVDRQAWGVACRGEFEDRLKAVIKEVTDSNGKIVLFIDEIHLVVGAGATGVRARVASPSDRDLAFPLYGWLPMGCYADAHM